MSRSIRIGRPEPAAPPPAPLALERVVTVFALLALLIGMFVPIPSFAAAESWSLTRTPSAVTGGAPASVQLTATSLGDDGANKAIGCVIVTIPASAFTVTDVVIDSVSDGNSWSSSFSGDGTSWYARMVADGGGQNSLKAFESMTASVTFTDTGLDGTFTWTGSAYDKEDCTGDFATPQAVSVTIDAPVSNTVPVAQPDSYSTGRNVALALDSPGVLANDDDPDGDPLTATQTSSPANGALLWGGDGSFTYTPDPGFVGTDSFTYQATDGITPSGDVTVAIDVTNGAPVAIDDAYSIAWSQTLVVPAPGILGNDSDPDGDGLAASVVSGPSNGVLVPNADGSFTYVPSPLFVGTDSFVYAASDGVTSTQATVVINVANAAPAAVADGPYAATEDTILSVPAPGVLANDSDDDGDSMTAVLVADAGSGSVTLAPDGSFDYVPDTDFYGTDSFTYRASDGLATSPATTVTISVAAVDDPPVASADTYATAEDTTLAVPAPGVLGDDSEVDGDALTAILVTPPTNGQLVLDADGGFEYVPDPDFHGPDSFTYALDDGTSSDTATVSLTVASVNDAPVAAPDSKGAPYATSVLVDVLANDADADADALTVSAVGPPSVGTVAIQSNRIRYTPAADFVGSATFTYTVSDGTATDTATVTVTVAPEPTPVPTPTPIPPTPEPTATPTLGPQPTPSPLPAATADPSPSIPAPSPSDSDTPSPSPSSPAAPSPTPPGSGEGGTLEPLAVPQVTTTFGSTDGFAFAGLFGEFGGSFAWAMPAAMLGVPGLLFMLAVAGQLLGAAAWIPAARRMLAGVGVRRRMQAGDPVAERRGSSGWTQGEVESAAG